MVNNGRAQRESESNASSGRGVGRRTFLKATGVGATGTALAGCIGGDGGSSAEGLTIGHLGPMESPLGIGSMRSAGMAATRVNDDGGVNGEDVEIIEGNTQAAPSEAQSVTEELIQQEDVDILIGAFASEVALSLLDMAANMDVPFLVTGSASPQVTRDHAGEDYERYKNTFRVGPINSDLQAEAIADYCVYLADYQDWDQLAFLRDNAAWTTSFEELLPGMLEERDLEIVYDSALSIDDPDISSVMDEVADTEADYILRFFAHIDGTSMLSTWHQGEYEFGIEGIHVTGMFPGYYQATEGAALYETTAQTGAAGVTNITEKTIPFVEAYQEQFADADAPPYQAPMYMGFNSYDAVEIASDVVNATGEAPRDNLDSFVEEALGITHTGVAGVQEFYGPDSEYPHDLKEVRDDEGRIENYPVTQWQGDGNLECVYPEVYRTADHVRADWI